MRKLLRGVSWVFKATLLAVAIAAAGVWARSWNHMGELALQCYTVADDRVDAVGYVVGWSFGRMSVGRGWETWRDRQLEEGRASAAFAGVGCKWHLVPGKSWGLESSWPGAVGPLRGYAMDIIGVPGLAGGVRAAAAPGWLVALIAGAWPVTSIGLSVRRRVRRRRRERGGCCIECGYDLRGTLGRCPECGAAAPSASPG